MALALREVGARDALAGACQALCARVYRDALGVDVAIVHDASAELLAAIDDATGEVVGTMELRRSGGPLPLLAAHEFELVDPWWRARPLVEGSRFAVAPEHRDGSAPLALVDGLRRYCRRHGARDVVAIAMLPDPRADVAHARAVLDWIAARAALDLSRARPAPGFAPGGWDAARPAIGLDAGTLPPMVRALAHRRSTLVSIPGYDPAVRAWSFLLTTRLGPLGDGT